MAKVVKQAQTLHRNDILCIAGTDYKVIRRKPSLIQDGLLVLTLRDPRATLVEIQLRMPETTFLEVYEP